MSFVCDQARFKLVTAIQCLFLSLLGALTLLASTVSVSAQNAFDDQSSAIRADAGHSRVVTVGVEARLDGSASVSPSNLPLTYSWSLTTKPEASQATLSDANTPMPSLLPDLAGEYRAELIVTDSLGVQSEASTVVLSTNNIIPVAVAGDDRVTTVGKPIRLDPEGTYDANGDVLEAIWSIAAFPALSNNEGDEGQGPDNSGADNSVCPMSTAESFGTFHAVSAVSQQQNPQLAAGAPLAEGTTETGSSSATTYYGPITMDLTGDSSIFAPEGEVIQVVLSSAWGDSARAEILMSRDGENYISLGTTGNGGSVYGAWSSNILRYDDFVVPAGGARFLKVVQQNGGVRADGVIYLTQCQSEGAAPEDETPEESAFASLEEDEGGRFVFTPMIEGEYTVQLTVKDTDGAMSSDTVAIYVLPEAEADETLALNLPPQADAGLNQFVSASETVLLDGSQSTDVNGERLSYEWSILSKPADSFSRIQNADQAIANLTPDTNRTYILQLKVTDETGASDFDTVVLSGQGVAPVAISGGPTPNADGAITAGAAEVSGQGSLAALGEVGLLDYRWSVLGLSEGQGALEDPISIRTDVSFTQSEVEGEQTEAVSLEGLELLERYSSVSFGDLNSNVDTAGRALVGGNVVGGSATFASRLQSVNGTAVLEVVGNIRGGPKNINGGGDVRVGGNVSSRVNLNGGGQIFEDGSLEIETVRQSAIALSENLSNMAPNSSADLPTNQNGPARLTASPDENGVAVFDIPDGRALFQNNRVQQIELNDNGASSIIFNIGGQNIQFNKGNFVGSINSDDISRRIIWNFHEATNLRIQRGFKGSVLAPFAKFHNQTQVDGSVIADSILARGRIGFPIFSGTGLQVEENVEEAKFSLIQLEVTNPQFPEIGPTYDSTVLTIGNKRPVASAVTSNGNGNVTPGSDVTLSAAGSFDEDSDPLRYEWSALSLPSGSQVELSDATSSAVSLSPDISGLYIFQLIISDGELSSRPTTVSFRVENTAPVADAGVDQTVAKGELVVLSGSNSSDSDGDTLTFTWALVERPDGSLVELTGSETVEPSFEADIGGTYVLSLVVNDGFEDSETDSVVVTVENNVPLASITGTLDGSVGDVFMLSGTGSTDADGDPLSYVWTLTAPEGSTATLSDVTSQTPMFTPDVAGAYTVTLVVNDGETASLPASLTATAVETNRPPILSEIGNRTIALGTTVSFQVSATDPDGDALRFSIGPLPLPAGASFDVNTGGFSFRPTREGQTSFTLSVSDGSLQDSETAIITVGNEEPTVGAQYVGRIVDARTQAPIDGILVTVGDITVRTDSDGNFTLTGLPPGANTIWVVSDGSSQISPDGTSYASTQIAVDLLADVTNVGASNIGLLPVTGSVPIVEDQPVSIAGGPFGISIDIPANGIEGATDLASFTSISPDQANALPPNIVPCQLFSLEPKTLRTVLPSTVSVDNYDNLPEGAIVDLWAFDGNGFAVIGSGSVQNDRISATVQNLSGGQAIAFAPRRGTVRITNDQPGNIFIPGLLNEGNLSTVFSLPTYTSVGAERAVSFKYNSTSAAPAPIVSAVTTLPGNSGAPVRTSQSVRIGDAVLSLDLPTDVNVTSANLTEIVQSGIFDGSTLPSGTYPVEFLSISEYACSQVGAAAETRISLNNETESPIGSGWTISELSKLEFGEDGRISIVDGSGQISTFSPEEEFGLVRETFVADVSGDNVPAIADFNSDGILDIIANDSARSSIRFFVGQTGGTNFIEDTTAEIVLGSSISVLPRPAGGNRDISFVRVGDFDSDGVPEIAVIGFSRNTLFILKRGENGYEVSQEISHPFNSFELIPADFNGDGFLDLATFGVGNIRFFLNDQSGNLSFAESQFLTGIDIDVEDFDGNGLIDIVVLNGSTARIRLNQGNLNFRDTNISLPRPANRFLGQLTQVGDVDLDGDIDFVVSTLPNVTYVENLGDGEFRAVELVRPSGFGDADNITLADVTGDGLLDVIVDERTPQPRYALFRKLRDGDYAPAEAVVFGHPIGESLVADIDGDGLQDLLSKSRFQIYVDFGQVPNTGEFNSPFGDFTSLTRNDDGTFTRRFTNGSTVTFSAAGLQTTTSDRNGNVTEYVYDGDGRLLFVNDPTGLETAFVYGPDGFLDSVTDPAGRTSIFTHDASGRLIEIRDPEDQPTRYSYDEQRRLISETDKRDLITTHSYGAGGRYTGSEFDNGETIGLSVARTLGLPNLDGDAGEFVPVEDRLTTIEDGRGNITTTEVNEFGAPVRTVDALGRETLFERNAANLVTAIVQPSSVTASGTLRTELSYDVRGNLTSKREAVGTALERVMSYEYEPVFSRPIRMTDADGFVTIMDYDEFGNKITETDPLGGIMQYAYNERGRIIEQVDKVGNRTEFEYDSFSRLSFITDASNIRQQIVRDDAGNRVAIIDDVDGPAEREMRYSYDDLNRKITETAADLGVTTYVYDGNDNVVSMIDPTGITETRTYDERDRLVLINDPASGATSFVYDEDNNILRMTDALAETTEFSYDAVNRLLSSVDAKGQLRAFAYDSRDNITAVTDARANITFMGYDALDRPVSRTNPRGEQWTFTYDGRDNRLTATKPDGVVLTSSFDGLSRLTNLAGGDVLRSYTYDAQSNLLAANDNLNALAGPELGFTYDAENRLETAAVTNLFGAGQQNNQFTYVYDALDRREQMTDSFGGTTAYGYDPVDRLARVTTPQGEVFTTNYDLAGRILGRVAPNVTSMNRSYEDDTGRMASQTQLSSEMAFNGFSYDYTDRGNLSEIAETGTLTRTRGYSYDELERLTDVTVPDAPTETETYTLDPEGNRESSHLSDTHVTDEANRLSEDANYSYLYDLNGNLTAKTAKPGTSLPDWVYRYDALDQLISVTRNGVPVERYRYDAFGRRSVIETANDNTPSGFERTGLVNDGSDRTIDLVLDGAGVAQIQNRYTHGGQVDEPLSVEAFNADGSLDQAYTYHADHLGSIRFITDSLGEIVNAYEYDSYGRPGFTLESVSQPFRYTGREWDAATELYHYRARQYDPDTGRFLQEDPIGFFGGDLNIYRYVGSNPISSKDPSGTTAVETSGTNRIALMASSSQAALGIRLACMFGNIAGLVETATFAASGNLAGASISGISSVGSCGGARVGLTASRTAKDAAETVLNRSAATAFVRTNGDILSNLATNQKLKRTISDLFRPGAVVGNGGTADAAIFTKLTGQLVGGSNHVQKVGDNIKRLNKLISSGNLGVKDLAIARVLQRDLQRANGFIK